MRVMNMDKRSHIQYSAPTASASAPESDPDADVGVGALDPDADLDAVEDARSDDAVRVLEPALVLPRELERVEEIKDVEGMSPAPEVDEDAADEVSELLLSEPRVRACEADEELDPSPSRPGRGEGAARPRVARTRNESKAEAYFIAKRRGK